MWFASQFCRAVYSHAEACCPVQGYEEGILLFFSRFRLLIFKTICTAVFSHCQSLWDPCLALLCLVFICHCFLFSLRSAVRYPLHGWARYNYPGLQPALGPGATLPRPSDAVADSTCPAEKVMLLAGAGCRSSVVAPLLELSHPAALSHQEAPAQAAAGSEMGNPRERHQAAARSRPARRRLPRCSSSWVLLALLVPIRALWHLTLKCR